MKKNLIMFLALTLLVSVFAACGSNEPQFAPDEAALVLFEEGTFTDLLSPVDAEIAQSLYALGELEITACSMYCSTGATAEEIAIFQCADAETAGQVELAAKARLASQADIYASYAPEAIPEIENAVLRVRGCYVACVVSGDAALASSILDRYMK